ncbi:hypothetical protein HDU86_002032 [Geranomyces michiganensis]|nr:hypothetical protein HDU86_002032 [Geranomyces michiganensis]
MGFITLVLLAVGALVARYIFLSFAGTKSRRDPQSGLLLPPAIPDVIPYLGPLAGIGYLIDPLAFARINHAKLGDVFSCTVLGKTLTFVQGEALIAAYSSASEAELSLLEAYKVMLGNLVGHDVFQPIGKEVYSALSAARVEKVLPIISRQAVEYIDKAFAEVGGATIDIAPVVNEAVVKIATTVLCDYATADAFGAQLAKDLHVLQNDHSPLAGWAPWATAVTARRADAKSRILQTFRDVAQSHLDAMTKNGGEGADGFITYLIHHRFGETKVTGKLDSSAALPRFVPREMEAAEHAAQMNGLVLLLYGMVFGAHSNTVMSTVSLVFDLLERPHMLSKVRAEASAHPAVGEPGFDLRNHVELNRAGTESWRIRSSGGLWRQVRGDGFALGEYMLAKGSLVTINQGVVNRNEQLYSGPVVTTAAVATKEVASVAPAAEEFDSDRYAKIRAEETGFTVDSDTQSPGASARCAQAATFGLGRHLCPGRLLAYRIAGCLVLAMLRYELTIAKQPKMWMRLPIAGIDRAVGEARVLVGKKLVAS